MNSIAGTLIFVAITFAFVTLLTSKNAAANIALRAWVVLASCGAAYVCVMQFVCPGAGILGTSLAFAILLGLGGAVLHAIRQAKPPAARP
jgi:hypothetical protein